MLGKALAVVQSKTALAILGVVLVGGGSTAAAYAATGHQLPLIGTHANATEKPDATHEAGDNHAHTVSVEGVLKGYDAGAATITVLSNSSTESTDKPEATKAPTTPEATEKPEATKAPATAEATEKPEATDKPEATKTPTTMTITVNAKTRVNGDHANTLADLAKNIGHRVEVQADKQSDGTLVAWKVTLQGAEGDNSGKGSTSGSGDGTGDSHSGDGQTTQVHALLGTISSVGAGSFVVKLVDGTTKTVTINAQTQFVGGAHSFADLKANVKVAVQGTAQSNGTFLATTIMVMATNQ